MAEEQVMPQTLVLPSENEKTLEKLRHMQSNNLTARQQEVLKGIRGEFIYEFKVLSWSFLGLSETQLKEFSGDGLKVLDKLISRKARPLAICQMLFTFGVPLFGWLIGAIAVDEGSFISYLYFRHRKYLRKVYGEEFLREIFKDKLQPKS